MLVFAFLVFALNAYADTIMNFSLNSSTMESTSVQNITLDEQTFNKNSISFFAQSSFAEEEVFLSMQTELINIAREEYTVNKTTFPQITNQGVRSLELKVMKYFYTDRGWRIHGEVGYNTKGYEEKDDSVQFSLLRDEYSLGMVFIRKPSNKGVFKPILLGMLGITEKAQWYVVMRDIIGHDYRAFNTTAYLLQPISEHASVKILGQSKNYRYNTPTPERIYTDERKASLSIIVHNKNYNAVEFSLYHDFNTKEAGASLGYSYYFRHNKTNPVTKVFNEMEDKYMPQKESVYSKKSNLTKEEIREMIIEILEERGLE